MGQLIDQEYGIKLHVRSVSKYLKRNGFTPQKPIKRTKQDANVPSAAWRCL